MRKPNVCVAGSANMDLVTTVSRMPVPGETILGSGFATFFGGKGANQAVMSARLGADVTMIGKVGADTFGKQYRDHFAAEGLNTDFVRVSPEVPTGIAAITVDENGQNAIIVVSGANTAITVAEIEQAAPAIQKAAIAVCQLEIPLEATLRFLEIARASQVSTLFNPAPAQTLPPAAYALSDFFCPNETEASLLTGSPVETLDDAERAAQKFLSRGAESVVLTLGSRGALYVSAERRLLVPAEKVKAVDTTGAGDAFIGSMAYFLAAGAEVEEAMRNASHAAALSVQKSGAQTNFPTFAECGFI